MIKVIKIKGKKVLVYLPERKQIDKKLTIEEAQKEFWKKRYIPNKPLFR